MTKKIHARATSFVSYNGRTHFNTLCGSVARSEAKAVTDGRVTCKNCLKRLPESWMRFIK